LEDTYTQRIEQLLTPVVGAGNVRAQVVADVELSMTEETSEQYNPQSQVVRSEQSSEENSRNGGGVQGVPGALSNQPPAAGVAAAPNAATNAVAAGPGANGSSTTEDQTNNSSKQTTRNYEIDRKLAYTKQLPGRLKRLTVAVLVDNLKATDDNGDVKETPWKQEQLDNMTKLVRDAVGYDEKRGDSINVVNSSFRPVAAPPANELQTTSLLDRPIVRDIAKLVIGLIVLLALIFAVLRPLMKSLMSGASLTPAPQALPELAQPMLAQQPAPNAAQAMGYEQQVSNARTVVNQDPRRVAQVVKTWVADNE